MIKNINVKIKLLLPISIIILTLLLLSTSFITQQYTKSKSLKELENGILLAIEISKAIHSTQKERGLTSGYISSLGQNFENSLKTQRKITDQRAKKLKIFLETVKNRQIKKTLTKALLDLRKINAIRKKVDLLSISTLSSLKFYSDMDEKFLNVIVEISKISKLPIITQNIIAYSNFLQAEENAGIERAVGTAIISQKNFTGNLRVEFTNLIAIQNLYTKNFLKYASDDGYSFYTKNIQGREITNLKVMREVILYAKINQDFGIDPEYWFKNSTIRIDKLKLIDDYLANEIMSNIDREIQHTYKWFGIYSLLNFISIIMFLTMVTLATKLIKSEKRLKDLTERYIISSTTDLKGTIKDISEAFCDISGYTRDELIGKPHNIIRHPDMPKSVFKNLWGTIQSGKNWQGRVKNLKKDGSYYWVYANIEPLFDKKGDIEAYAAVRIDITDSVYLEEELERSYKKDQTMLHQSKLAQMGEMISMIAHQWRQPLTAISSTSGNLSAKMMLNNYDQEYFSQKLEKIDELSQHLSGTIDDFRNFYKEDKEKVETKLSTMVEGALSIVATSIK
ncbi:MAG: nitrate- and nitrite sensing domain-containing protein, partial [Campylobacterota bacterium]|nr:nitrate- and nitrite sensing domain-containing protein [Campylobacterota bacterium]